MAQYTRLQAWGLGRCYHARVRAALPPGLEAFVAAGGYAGLRLLVLFGSRARGDARAGSDWDFGFLADAGFDADRLMADIVRQLRSERIDLVDLARAGAQLRFRAARDATVVFEAEPGVLGRFWLDAVQFWCDVAPVLQRGYAGVLERLGP